MAGLGPNSEIIGNFGILKKKNWQTCSTGDVRRRNSLRCVGVSGGEKYSKNVLKMVTGQSTLNPYLEIVDKKSTNWDLSERHLWTKNPQNFFLGIQ